MTYTPSELFTSQIINVEGHYINPKGIHFVSKVLSDYSITVEGESIGLDLPFDNASEAHDAHDTLIKAWDMELQREAMQKQFERGLEVEQEEAPHGVEIVVNMPLDTPKDTIKSAIDEAKSAILARVDDVGGGL